MLHFINRFNFNIKSYQWPIYLRCKAGGTASSPTGGLVVPFDYLLNNKMGTAQLNGVFNWVKCNNDFKSYYITEYTNSQFETFEQVLLVTNVSDGDIGLILSDVFHLVFFVKIYIEFLARRSGSSNSHFV
jgi:hypothetical protein